MALNDLFRLWNQAFIKVVDVRRQIACRGEQTYLRELPACTFLFSIRGSANVLLGDVQYKVSRFHLLHGGKGLRCELLVADGEFEYYLIYYKAMIPLPCRQEIARLMERTNWFQQPYAYVPQQPIPLLDSADTLLSIWLSNGEDSLRKLRAKTVFHQFVCELFEQMHEQQKDGSKPDLVAQAKQYIQAHYAEPITLGHIAHDLHYSAAYVTKHETMSTRRLFLRMCLSRAVCLAVTPRFTPISSRTSSSHISTASTEHSQIGSIRESWAFPLVDLFPFIQLSYPQLFGRVVSFSGSFWFPGIAEWIEKLAACDTSQRLFMNLGHAEGSGRTNGQQWMVPNSKRIYHHLLQHSFTQSTARQVIYESEFHSFDLGVQYVPESLQWLFAGDAAL